MFFIFKASNMRWLEKLAVTPLTDALLSNYEDIRHSDDPAINSSFMLADSSGFYDYSTVGNIFERVFKN